MGTSKPRFRPPRGLTKTLVTSFASTSQIRCARHVVGDKAEIERLLSHITHIGAKVGVGYGRVRRWEVAIGGDKQTARLHRPLPKAFADTNGVSGMLLECGHRPPIRVTDNQRLCVIPYAG